MGCCWTADREEKCSCLPTPLIGINGMVKIIETPRSIMHCVDFFILCVCVCVHQVCLSILNTWHGRPEEKWNPQTSSFLQVRWRSIMTEPPVWMDQQGCCLSLCVTGYSSSLPCLYSARGSLLMGLVFRQLTWRILFKVKLLLCFDDSVRVLIKPNTNQYHLNLQVMPAYTHHSSWSQNQLASIARSAQTPSVFSFDLVDCYHFILKTHSL